MNLVFSLILRGSLPLVFQIYTQWHYSRELRFVALIIATSKFFPVMSSEFEAAASDFIFLLCILSALLFGISTFINYLKEVNKAEIFVNFYGL